MPRKKYKAVVNASVWQMPPTTGTTGSVAVTSHNFAITPTNSTITQSWVTTSGTGNVPFQPQWFTPEERDAYDYMRACADLDLTRAGKRARRLLMSFLDEQQREDYHRKHEITTKGSNGEHYILERGVPNGNIILCNLGRMIGLPDREVVKKVYKGDWEKRYNYLVKQRMWHNNHLPWVKAKRLCFHPLIPYPNDDIMLTQLFALWDDADALTKAAHVTQYVGEHHMIRSIV